MRSTLKNPRLCGKLHGAIRFAIYLMEKAH